MKILIVDDLDYVRTIIRVHLEGLGHTVVEANDGKPGASTCLRERPDLTITDMSMLFMDGPEMIERIRSFWPEARFIGMSGTEGWTLPADVPLIIKPIELSRLEELIR